MFARKEAFHVERLKPPMNTRKMVEARGRGPTPRPPRLWGPRIRSESVTSGPMFLTIKLYLRLPMTLNEALP